MRKLLKHRFELFILLFSLYNWFTIMIRSSDITAGMGIKDASYSILLILICGFLYIKCVKSNVVNMTSLFPLMLWFIEFLSAIVFHYHPYLTVVTIVGTVVSAASFLYVRSVKLNKMSFNTRSIKIGQN